MEDNDYLKELIGKYVSYEMAPDRRIKYVGRVSSVEKDFVNIIGAGQSRHQVQVGMVRILSHKEVFDLGQIEEREAIIGALPNQERIDAEPENNGYGMAVEQIQRLMESRNKKNPHPIK